MSASAKRIHKYRLDIRESLGKGQLSSSFSVIKNFDFLANEIYLQRASKKDGAVSSFEDELANLGQEILALSPAPSEKKSDSFNQLYHKAWKDHFPLFLLSLIVFIAAYHLGISIGSQHQDYVPLIVGQHMAETILDKEAWFEEINGNNIMSGLAIAANNIKVSFFIYLAGALIGVGGLALLFFNALSFGAVYGFCAANDFSDPLREFVYSHGFLEITILIASCFAALILGRVFYMRPLSLLGPRMSMAAKESMTVILGVLPWLILAATMEGLISPNELVPGEIKILLGLFCAILFWIWTLLPRKVS